MANKYEYSLIACQIVLIFLFREYPLNRMAFLEYLQTQHCDENILFLDAVALFNNSPTPDKAREVNNYINVFLSLIKYKEIVVLILFYCTDIDYIYWKWGRQAN